MNSVHTADGEADLEFFSGARGFDGVLLPKVETAGAVELVARVFARHAPLGAVPPLLLLLETPRAILRAAEIAAADAPVAALLFGAEDLTASLAVERTTDGEELSFARAQIALAAACTVSSAATLDFATGDALAAHIDQTSTIRIACSGTTPYSIGLDAGAGAGATAAVRKLTGAAASVDYALYRDGARTTLWGDTVGIDAEAATCSGVAQTYTLYGRVTAQPTPAVLPQLQGQT